jgi:hypothetical protein
MMDFTGITHYDDYTVYTRWLEAYVLDRDILHIEVGKLHRWQGQTGVDIMLSVDEAEQLQAYLTEFIKQNGG